MSTNGAQAGPDGRFELEAEPGNAYDLEVSDPQDRYSLAEIKGLEPVDGRFHLVLDEPGPRRLSFTPAPELGLEGVIELEAEVQGGPNRWSHDLAFGEVYGRCPPIATGDSLALCNREGSSPSFFLTIQPDSNDRYRLPYVPAGPAEVRRYSQRDGQPSQEVLGELVVRAGAEQQLDVP